MKALILLLLMLTISSEIGSGPPGTITIANPPWHPYFGEDLPQYGMASAIISEAFKRAGFRVNFKTRPWARAMLEVKYGEHDAVATAYYTEERAKQYFFSIPYMTSEVLFYKRAENPIQWSKLEDLKPYSIGIVLKNSYSPEFDAATFLNRDASTSELINIRRLAAGRIDLLVMDRYVFEYLIKQFPEYKIKLVALDPPLYKNSLYVMFSKKSEDIHSKINAFNQALKQIKTDGTFQEIINQHLINR